MSKHTNESLVIYIKSLIEENQSFNLEITHLNNFTSIIEIFFPIGVYIQITNRNIQREVILLLNSKKEI